MIGAGVAGLACAATLSRAGLRVCVLEARGCLGGRARSWRDAHTGVVVDIGPHVVSTEHRQFMRLLRQLGTDRDVSWQPQPLIELHDAQGRLTVPMSDCMPPLHGLPMLPARLLHARVHRIRPAIPQPRPGSETLRPANRTAVAGLLLAGDWTDTAVPCSMESAARSAALACEAVLGPGHALPAPETCGLVGLLRRRA